MWSTDQSVRNTGGGRWGPSLNRQHIYRKLGVHSKAGVLKAAKDLRLLKE